ncbi:MAG: hypothetical protein NC420_00645 [Eubacterium sp.]|nr:hypothetical protein [Eubacterium sp.]MCM1303354.1 hypothetical protein [Butyrivibrio sp.]MCM1342956.1 hypothetical protein [Muribaculaceae bacterium]MCM1411598.1 hypothetical protein [Lachnospiraceae bacterium]
MAELIRNAWTGWFRITSDGKIMALFLISLLFLWIGHRQEKQVTLLRYGTASALCCIVPVTASALMLYQTRFYDYEWIWSIVPVTIVTAYAGTKALAEHWQGFRREAWRKGLPVTAGLLAVVFLCVGPDGAGVDRESERVWRERTENIVEAARIRASEGDLCMWAPRKVMEYARRVDSSILLPYGRNMWEEALGAYSYDTYLKEIEKMYLWMSLVEETCTESDADITDMVLEKMEEQDLSTGECLDAARRAGVSVLVLPEDTNRMLFNEVVTFTGDRPEQSLGYYFFQL